MLAPEALTERGALVPRSLYAKGRAIFFNDPD